MAAFLQDNFDRADGTPGSNWVVDNGTWAISGNKLVQTQPTNTQVPTGWNIETAITAPSSADRQRIRVKLKAPTEESKTIGAGLKKHTASSQTNFYIGQVRRLGSGVPDQWQIYRFNGPSSYTLLNTGTAEDFVDDTEIEVGYDNGVITLKKWDGSQWVTMATANDTAFAGVLGKAMLRVNSNQGSPSFDDFIWESIEDAPAATHTASGTITSGGNPLQGVTVTASGGSTASDTTDASGNYSIPGLIEGQNYTITPSLGGYAFSPVNAQFTPLNSDQTGVDFTAAQVATSYWSDPFDRADGALGPDWSGTAFVISGNRAVPANLNTAECDWNRPFDNRQYGPDVAVSAKVWKPTGSLSIGVRARSHIVTDVNYYFAAVLGSGEVMIAKMVEGAGTVLAQTTGQAWVDGSILTLECIGNTHKAYAGGVEILSVNDSAFQEISGTCGIRTSVNNSTGGIEDFAVSIPTGLKNLVVGPTIGDVTSASAKISFRISTSGNVSIEYSQNADMSGSTTTAPVAVDGTTDFCGVVQVTGLTANTQYYFRVKIDSVNKNLSPFPTFTTAPAAGTATSLKLAFGSCNADVQYGANNDTVFQSIASKAPKMLIHLGDTAYQDRTATLAGSNLAKLRANHRITQQAGTKTRWYADLRRKVPVYNMWDDHDLVNDYDDGPSGALYTNAKQAWQEYVGLTNPAPLQAGGLYYSFQYGNIGFFVLDQRSFRSANSATDNASKTILGAQQKADLKAWLLNNKNTFKVKVICSPTPAHGFASNTGNDSWGGEAPPSTNTGFRTERNEIYDYINDNQIPGVIWISADQHWPSMVRQTRGEVTHYECCVSPFGNVPLTATPNTDPAILYKTSGASSYFGTVDIDTTVSPATITFKIHDAAGTELHTTSITTNDISQFPDPEPPGELNMTQISDTIYFAEGTLASGRVIVSWKPFVTAEGVFIAPGEKTIPVSSGVFSAELQATPEGFTYKVSYQLDGPIGKAATEYWAVPVSATPVRIGTIRRDKP